MEKKFFFNQKNLKSGPNPYGSALPFFEKEKSDFGGSNFKTFLALLRMMIWGF
jgi:hypothetical protein